MMVDLAIKGGSVALPGAEPAPATILVNDGRIAAIAEASASFDAADTLDASGLTVLPGVLDVHLHLGHGKDISRPRTAEDADKETAAAAVGGVTTMIPYMFGKDPYEDVFEEIEAITTAGARIDYGYHFVISTDEQLAGVPRYAKEFGAPSFKIFMNNRGGEGARLGLPDIDDGFLMRLCELAAANGGMVCPHPENIEVAWLLRKRLMEADPQGKGGISAWNDSRPPFVEADAVQRAALFGRISGAPIYIVHTSSAEALEAARVARDHGANITIETCPHYLTHDVDWSGGDIGKINPPLRTKADREALWQGIRTGVVDTVATDHVHRDISSKAGGIWAAGPGCPGMDTLLPVMLSEGHHKRGIPLRRIVSLLSEKPAAAMGLADRKGRIAVGHDADFAIVDLGKSFVHDAKAAPSSAGYSIYDGWTIKGQVVHTLVRGRAVLDNGKLVDAAVGTGRYLKRRLAN